jgi:hypothetical protein
VTRGARALRQRSMAVRSQPRRGPVFLLASM